MNMARCIQSFKLVSVLTLYILADQLINNFTRWIKTNQEVQKIKVGKTTSQRRAIHNI